MISIITRVELEGGVYREPAHAPVRRARLDAILSAIAALAFDDLATEAYGTIVASAGYSRRKLSSARQYPCNHGSIILKCTHDTPPPH